MNELSDLTAVILAGGLGTRLRSVVADRPKVIAEVGGRPFLSYLLDQLGTVGIQYVVLCTGYLGQKVRAIFGDSYAAINLVYSHEKTPMGTGGALVLAAPLLKSESVLVMNSDSFFETNLEAFWTFHRTKNAEAALTLVKVPDTKRFGRVRVNSDDLVLG